MKLSTDHCYMLQVLSMALMIGVFLALSVINF